MAASVQHATGSEALTRRGSNVGMDMIIYKISDDGVLVGVYAVDLTAHDGESEPRS